MKRNIENEYIPYNEQTYNFSECFTTLKRLQRVRGIVVGFDVFFIIVCLALMIVSFGWAGFGTFAYLLTAAVTAGTIVCGTMYRLNFKINVCAALLPVFLALLIATTGMITVYTIIGCGIIFLSAVMFAYLGVCEKPLSETPGYPYFNALSYESSQKKEYVPEHRIYETRGSMDEINTDDINTEEISSDFSKGE